VQYCVAGVKAKEFNMRNSIILLACLLALTGCSSMARSIHYADLAKEHDFAYFFPKSDSGRRFSTIDEAYDFVQTASIKFAKAVSNKNRNKGLGAKLFGPAITEAPVTVIYMVRASDMNGAIDLSKIDKPMDTVLRSAEDALLFFAIFYNDRAVSLSNYYLDPKYSGYTNGNAQVKEFGIAGNTYETQYPVGWGVDKVFQYLKGEID
jgi:hypothetical protein